MRRWGFFSRFRVPSITIHSNKADVAAHRSRCRSPNMPLTFPAGPNPRRISRPGIWARKLQAVQPQLDSTYHLLFPATISPDWSIQDSHQAATFLFPQHFTGAIWSRHHNQSGVWCFFHGGSHDGCITLYVNVFRVAAFRIVSRNLSQCCAITSLFFLRASSPASLIRARSCSSPVSISFAFCLNFFSMLVKPFVCHSKVNISEIPQSNPAFFVPPSPRCRRGYALRAETAWPSIDYHHGDLHARRQEQVEGIDQE
uniref:Uncharacterized protein n=1 Tax=Candidatus Kentrum sp. LFY TaxID=2126342 RepID=A0A450U7K3_9GAMM|nr:MAG: hypothetical protein BECKLFY1418B_GA0070995_10087 [Candidatus Kentron sp. LFY]